MVQFHYGPYDRFHDFKAFLSVPPRPLGAGFYPPTLTREKVREFIARNPQQKQLFTSPFTIIREMDSGLVAIPYHDFYSEQVRGISKELLAASKLEGHPQFSQYLKQRSVDVLTDRFSASDELWVQLSENPIDIIIGPYEVYEDHLLGIKASYEGMLLSIDLKASLEIQSLRRNIGLLKQRLERELGLRLEVDESKVRISIANLLYAGGEARSGNPAIAFNLPNDEQVIERVGARQVILKNVLEAKFQHTVYPIIQSAMKKSALDVEIASQIFLHQTIYHEISHSLGPHVITVNGEATTVNSRLGQYHSVLRGNKSRYFRYLAKLGSL